MKTGLNAIKRILKNHPEELSKQKGWELLWEDFLISLNFPHSLFACVEENLSTQELKNFVIDYKNSETNLNVEKIHDIAKHQKFRSYLQAFLNFIPNSKFKIAALNEVYQSTVAFQFHITESELNKLIDRAYLTKKVSTFSHSNDYSFLHSRIKTLPLFLSTPLFKTLIARLDDKFNRHDLPKEYDEENRFLEFSANLMFYCVQRKEFPQDFIINYDLLKKLYDYGFVPKMFARLNYETKLIYLKDILWDGDHRWSFSSKNEEINIPKVLGLQIVATLSKDELNSLDKDLVKLVSESERNTLKAWQKESKTVIKQNAKKSSVDNESKSDLTCEQLSKTCQELIRSAVSGYGNYLEQAQTITSLIRKFAQDNPNESIYSIDLQLHNYESWYYRKDSTKDWNRSVMMLGLIAEIIPLNFREDLIAKLLETILFENRNEIYLQEMCMTALGQIIASLPDDKRIRQTIRLQNLVNNTSDRYTRTKLLPVLIQISSSCADKIGYLPQDFDCPAVVDTNENKFVPAIHEEKTAANNNPSIPPETNPEHIELPKYATELFPNLNAVTSALNINSITPEIKPSAPELKNTISEENNFSELKINASHTTSSSASSSDMTASLRLYPDINVTPNINSARQEGEPEDTEIDEGYDVLHSYLQAAKKINARELFGLIKPARVERISEVASTNSENELEPGSVLKN